MQIIVPVINTNGDLFENRKRGQVWQCGSVFVIPLDNETGFIFDSLTNHSMAYFYLVEGLDDFGVSSDQLVLTSSNVVVTVE